MRTGVRTVKHQVTLIMVSFCVFVTAMILVFSFYLMYTFQRRITINSVEFNLQLVTGMIGQDLQNLVTLASLCGNGNSDINNYFLSGGAVEKILGVRAYTRINNEIMHNRTGLYVRRLAVVNNNLDKILHAGNYSTTGLPMTRYNVEDLFLFTQKSVSVWEQIIKDPYSKFPETQSLLLRQPVYHPRNRSEIGSVFVLASTGIITDKLKGYRLTDDSELFLTIGGSDYLIKGDAFIPVEAPYTVISENTTDPVSENTTALIIARPDGARRTAVIYPIRDGVSLTQILSQEQFFPRGGAWFGLLAALLLLIVMLALFVIYRMDRTVSQPVARLHRKIDAITVGDFSPDFGLESDTEIGLVGRGVNNLSRNVVALMEKRIADENEKRELEYRMLQNQISPHFLYNTLNSIKWMAQLQGADGISEMTTALSRLLKSVAKDIRKVSMLGEELAMLGEYLVIQKYRYGDSVQMTQEIENPDLLDALTPRFSLQPLVENAIFHGLEPKGGGNIWLRVYKKNGDVYVDVTDDGVGIKPEVLNRLLDDDTAVPGMFSKLGLKNVDERCRVAFGVEYGLSIQSEAGKYTTMTLRLPPGAGKEKSVD